MTKLSNWGNTPEIDAHIVPFHKLNQLKAIIPNTKNAIARGLGRCYGDTALNATVISTTDFNQIISFDKDNGILVCQSGISFAELLDIIVPHGWFLPVTPGSKFVTMGGAVAANVHGKNHHVDGSLSNHILKLTILKANGELIHCSKDDHSDLFHMTCGGMGLTGVITEITIQLRPIESAYIRKKTIRAKNLSAIMDLFETHHDWTYSVAWIDCLAKGNQLGRSLLYLGEHAKTEEIKKNISSPFQLKKKLKLTVPFYFPEWVLNKRTIRTFNQLYYRFSSNKQTIVDYDSFFYPLDHIHHWNRLYGKKGFTQYQCVLPLDRSREGLSEILSSIASSGQGSFLAVLKRFGNEPCSGLSFPMEGYTLALDFPINTSSLQLMTHLDEIVSKNKGRLYLAKDSRMSASFFSSSYPNLDAFKSFKKTIDKQSYFRSVQSERLNIHEVK